MHKLKHKKLRKLDGNCIPPSVDKNCERLVKFKVQNYRTSNDIFGPDLYKKSTCCP